MIMRSFLFLAAVVLAGCAHGSDGRAGGRQLQLDWQVITDARGAVVRGQIGNPYGAPVRDVHLLVEGLDARGEVVTRTTTALKRIVLSGERAPFDLLVPGQAETYRVSVVTFEVMLPRGGR